MSLRTCDSSNSSQNVESFLTGLNTNTIESKLESKMRRLLSKYRERKSKEMNRKKEWDKVNSQRPNPDEDHPDDVKAIEEAQETIGYYKLKSDLSYEPGENEKDSTLKKYNELLTTREEVYFCKKIFYHYNTHFFRFSMLEMIIIKRSLHFERKNANSFNTSRKKLIN